MDPAGVSTCAQDHYTLDQSHPHALCDSGPEARLGPPEYLRPELGPNRELQLTEADLREEQKAELERKSKDQYGWRRVVRNFTPSYAKIHLKGCDRRAFLGTEHSSHLARFCSWV